MLLFIFLIQMQKITRGTKKMKEKVYWNDDHDGWNQEHYKKEWKWEESAHEGYEGRKARGPRYHYEMSEVLWETQTRGILRVSTEHRGEAGKAWS